MDKITNFRGLGEKVKSVNLNKNLIFRSSAPEVASENDIERLKELKIKNIYDFRSSEEIKKHIGQMDNYFIHNNLCALETTKHYEKKDKENINKEELLEFMQELYYEELPRAKCYKDFIKSIVKQESPEFLFHCRAGKDRTGIAGAILMKIFGCTDDEIYEEFLEIDEKNISTIREQLKKSMNLTENEVKEIEPVLYVYKEFLDTFFKGINDKHGSFENYIKSYLEIEDSEIKKLKSTYICQAG